VARHTPKWLVLGYMGIHGIGEYVQLGPKLAFCRRLELLPHCLIKARLRAPWSTPSAQSNVILVVLPSSEEDRGQVERTVSPTRKLSGTVIRKTLDPFGSWTKVEFWVLFVLVSRYLRSVVLARHSRRQR
jgi:hypothetical protein